jgi:hypothetical protein
VLFVVDHPGVEAVAEDVPAAVMSSVEELRVDAVEAVQASRERRTGGLDDEMVVRPHEAERVAAPSVPFDCFREQAQERDAVRVVAEERLAVDGACRHVVDPVGERPTKRSGHVPNVWARVASSLFVAPVVTRQRRSWRTGHGRRGQQRGSDPR